jgi:CDP-Glycerol:Poly(glycerophosphate) glycerophosphotransferase
VDRLKETAEALANHQWMRLMFAGMIVLLPVACVALVAGNSWAFVVALTGSTVLDGVLRMAPVGKGRMLQVLRERASQLSTLRITLIGLAFYLLASELPAAVVTGAGLVGSVLSRTAVGWFQEYGGRAGWDFAAGRSVASGNRHWFEEGGAGQRYSRGLAVTELLCLVGLTAALLGAAGSVVILLAAIAWIPSLELALAPVWRWLRTRGRAASRVTAEVVPGRVAVYFPDPVSRAYQLQQWLPVLADLHRDLGVLLVFRDRRVFDLFGELCDLPRFFARTLDDLAEMYAGGDHGVVLYVNNGWRNFQSLAWPRALHVHINHGESDKTSLVTHQSRAYDRVLVAGRAAIDRMVDGLLEVDTTTVTVVGRPQLDYVDLASAAARGPRPVVVYAPTWEGENDANNFSSVDIGGPAIVQTLLTVPEVTVLYKPHPRTPASPLRAMRESHRAICRLLASATAADPGGGHGVWAGDILPLLARADVLVADVSSVAVDHLYLRPDAGLVLMDRGRDGGDVAAAEIPIARAAIVLRADQPGDLAAAVPALLDSSAKRPERAAVRREYFDNYDVGESTRRFQAVVAELVALRDQRVVASGAARSLSVESAP